MLDRSGLIAAIFAYTAWGFFPLYWHYLKHISALETMSHRVIWSFVFYGVVAHFRGSLPRFTQLLKNRRTVLHLTFGAVFLAANWLLYVWAVTHGHVMETSLGYFINPLINVAVGSLFLKEHLSRNQKSALLTATLGVLWLTYDYGRPPWIALALAVSFATYSIVKKLVPGEATLISMAETLVLFPVAIAAAIAIRWLGPTSDVALLHTRAALSAIDIALLVLGGAITGIPLLLFGVAAQRLPLTVLGFFQYLAPTFQFLSAVLFFHEPLGGSRLIGFSMIWLALAIFIHDTWRSRSNRAALSANDRRQ